MDADSSTLTHGVRKATPYFANIKQRGPLKYRDVPGSIAVLESPDNAMSIGQAGCKTWDENGLAVWTLSIRGQPIKGR
jgi:hypothetical protein